MSEEQLLEKAAEVVKEVVPEIYEDGLKSSVKEAGIFLERPLRVLNTLFQGLDLWLAKREYNFERTKQILAEKIKNIPEEELISPEPYIAIPGLEALSYSIDSEELRNLYANLLSSSMIIWKKDKVHPSFVEIIKQLSPNDAIIFKEIMEYSLTPMIDLYIKIDGGGNVKHRVNLSWLNGDYETISVSISNLVRLGLIEVPDEIHYIQDEHYDIVRRTSTYQDVYKKLEREILLSGLEGKVKESKKYIRKTALSYSFYDICVQ